MPGMKEDYMVSSLFVHFRFHFSPLPHSHCLHLFQILLLRRWAIRDKATSCFAGVFISQHLGLLCVRNPNVMSCFCGPIIYLPMCRSLTWEISPLVRFMNHLLSPALWPINTDLLSGGASSLQTLLLRKFLKKFSDYLFFVGPHMAHRKKNFLNLVTLEMQAITGKALSALTTPHSPLSIGFSRVVG